MFGAEEFAKACNVSRETLARLEAYVALLREWNEKHNLVSRNAMTEVWKRHVWDSAQLARFIPEDARSLVDLGSGAGFPGLVLALLRDDLRVSLYEATGKKATFLAEAAKVTGLRIDIRSSRIEKAKREVFDVVTARACAPLAQLLAYAQLFVGPKTVCLFLKGQNVDVELTEARKSWRMKLQRHQSLTDPSGAILEIRELAHVQPHQR